VICHVIANTNEKLGIVFMSSRVGGEGEDLLLL
jgi:hypothetical protein